jgi:tRNA threonylcarbamoyladenosine biosynthesis protein TsaB
MTGRDAAAGTVLALDGSTLRATAAVLRAGAVLADVQVANRDEHVEPLLPAILDVLSSLSLSAGDIDAIVCGAGPGSFTSLRTAAAIAKGLATPRALPVYGVPSLALIVAGNRSTLGPGPFLAVLDAGRDERFALPIRTGERPASERTVLLPAAAIPPLAHELGATVVGPASDVWPHARGAVHLSWGDPVDLASWEPDYGRNSAAQDRRGSARP